MLLPRLCNLHHPTCVPSLYPCVTSTSPTARPSAPNGDADAHRERGYTGGGVDVGYAGGGGGVCEHGAEGGGEYC
ncbi:hypothetical protein BV22DRAFT_1040944 [Leucogyrophana mollusca]|uniref:Uncharacterized protein n=1 Tax=Leucogyrophana mollusca TaxID=85980 RepID=A0ACB8B2E3_9AGAM|nr:hypothetical protein BV22DRAFT_1040944 [Leucogyrophana mollusca]